MKPFSIALVAVGLVATLAPSSVHAQQRQLFELPPTLTNEELKTFAGDAGALLRFRQFGDADTIGKGRVDVSVQFAGDPLADSKGAWNAALPAVAARAGVNDRVDIGAFGAYNAEANYGMAGADTKIVLMREGASWPVTVALRPSVTALIGPADAWVGSASIDLSVSRAIGPLSPYAGVATTGAIALERLTEVDLDPAAAHRSLSYAGLAYRWRAIIVAAEVEKAAEVSYGVRIGTRF